MCYTFISKAFNCVCHSLLIKTLELCGIHSRLRDWFESYRVNRQIIVWFGSATYRGLLLHPEYLRVLILVLFFSMCL